MSKQLSAANHFFFRGCLFGIYIISSACLALRVRSCVYQCVDKHVLALQIAECFVGITIPISVYHAWEHLTNFVKPRLQSQIVRIIWIVPIYSLECLLSIQFMEHAFYFQAIREIYESYVIYCFMRFLLHFLGDGRNLTDRLASMPASMGYHKPPFCWLQPWQMGSDFLRRCKAGVFQFVVVRFLLAVLILLLRIIGCYDEGNYSSNSSYLWITLVCCCSQSWALYSLFMFYHCSHRELITMRPFMKFFCLKMVIFFCWWQALGIGLLVKLGHINGAGGHSVQEVADLIQDLLISMEMLVAAIAFFISFPISEFATVRQLNWPLLLSNPSSSSAIVPSDLSGTGTNAVSSESQSLMKVAFVPPMGGLLASSVACIANSLIGHTQLALSNPSDSQANSSDSSSNPPQPTIVMAQQIYMSMPDLPADLSPSSPPGDFENCPSMPARKIFLPYAVPPASSDRNVMKDRKEKNAQRLNDRRDWGVEGGLRSDPQPGTEKRSAFNLSAPLSLLGGIGFITLKSLIPSFAASSSSSYSASTSGSKKKTERYDASPSTVDVGTRQEAAAECDSDPEVASLIRRGSFDSSKHCTGGSSPDGCTTGDGAYSAGRCNTKGFVSIATTHQSETAGSFVAVSDSRGGGGGGGMNTGPNQDMFPSPVARRRAVVSNLTAAIVNAKAASSHFDDYLEEDDSVEEFKALIHPKRPSPSFFLRSSISPFSHDKDHSPFNSDKGLSIGEGGGESPFQPLNIARGSLDNRRKVFSVPRDDSMEILAADASSASFYPPRSSFSAALDSIHSTASEASEGAHTPPSSSGPSSVLSELHYFPGGYSSGSSMLHSSQAYISPQRDLFRESARDSLSIQMEGRHLSRGKDHFIGNSSGTAVYTGGDSSGGIGSSAMLCQQSALQALLTCTMPRELHEDIQELGAYVADSYITPPYAVMKKWVKGQAAHS